MRNWDPKENENKRIVIIIMLYINNKLIDKEGEEKGWRIGTKRGYVVFGSALMYCVCGFSDRWRWRWRWWIPFSDGLWMGLGPIITIDLDGAF